MIRSFTPCSVTTTTPATPGFPTPELKISQVQKELRSDLPIFKLIGRLLDFLKHLRENMVPLKILPAVSRNHESPVGEGRRTKGGDGEKKTGPVKP